MEPDEGKMSAVASRIKSRIKSTISPLKANLFGTGEDSLSDLPLSQVSDKSLRSRTSKTTAPSSQCQSTAVSSASGKQPTKAPDEPINTAKRDPKTCAECSKPGCQLLLECEYCERRLCGKCANLKTDGMKAVTLYKNIHWYCPHCELKATGAVTNAKYSLGKSQTPEDFINQRIISSIDDALQAMNEKVVQATKAVEENVKRSYAEAVKTINVVTPPANPSGVTGTALTHNDTNMRELQDRNERKNNLVIFGVPESESNNRDTCQNHDAISFQEICQAGLGIDANITQVTRLGPKNDSKPRPLRIKLPEESLKWEILRQAKNLANSSDPLVKQIFIRRDMTYMEREEDRKLRQELRERRAESTELQDGARWIIRRGRVMNVARSPRDRPVDPQAQGK